MGPVDLAQTRHHVKQQWAATRQLHCTTDNRPFIVCCLTIATTDPSVSSLRCDPICLIQPLIPKLTLVFLCCSPCQSAIEETIERIKLHKGVERYIILGADGAVLRSYPQVSGLCCFSMLQLDRPNETSRGQRKGQQKDLPSRIQLIGTFGLLYEILTICFSNLFLSLFKGCGRFGGIGCNV